MNILILNWKDVKNPEVGGAEIIAFEFARRLVKDGHTVTFFSRSFKGAQLEEIIDGVRIIRRGGKLSVYPHAYFYYKNLKTKPDKVIDMINTICWQTPLYVPKEKRIAYLNQLAKEVFFYELPFGLSHIAYVLERFQFLPYRKTTFLVYSESTEKDLKEFGVEATNVRLFPMGLDHKRYITGNKKASYPMFLFVARLVRMKRPDLCIRAMEYIKETLPDAKLVIMGNGPYENGLIQLVNKMKLQDTVIFANKNNFFIDQDKKDTKIQLMQEAWTLLLPSVKEGWGMVVTEAAACGTPSIVTDVTGLRDSVKDNISGIVLSANPTPKELGDAMIRIAQDQKLRDKLSQGAITWSKEFSWDKSYEGFKKQIRID